MIWYIAIGSALGGVARYLLGGLIQRLSGGTFPTGTLLINVTGSFLLGFLYRYASESAAITPEVRAMLTIGFCGGYTTFSTFTYETARLLEDGETVRALAYIGLSVCLSLGAVVLGLAAGRELLILRRG
jgi:fluoride exporter